MISMKYHSFDGKLITVLKPLSNLYKSNDIESNETESNYKVANTTRINQQEFRRLHITIRASITLKKHEQKSCELSVL